MSSDEFVLKVKQMRQAQKDYFRADREGRPSKALILKQSKELEREVDASIIKIESKQITMF